MSTFSRTLLALALSAAPLGAQALSFGFDSGSEGWVADSGGTVTWLGSGGNPGGFLQIADVSNDDFLLVAPTAALGNWSAYLGGSLSFEARNVNAELPDWQPFGEVTLSGPGGSVVLDIAPLDQPPADGQWHRYSASLSAAAWGPTLGAVLADVRSLTIKGEFHAGVTEVVGIDNISVVTTAVPEPGSLGLMVAGLLGVGLALSLNRRR